MNLDYSDIITDFFLKVNTTVRQKAVDFVHSTLLTKQVAFFCNNYKYKFEAPFPAAPAF